jgi:hypothetical protein
MRSVTGVSAIAAAAAPTLGLAVALAWGTAPASACGDPCWSGYGGSAYAYGYAPAPVYAAPPVYAYSYYGADYPYGPPYYGDFYVSRVNVFHGPRWNYAAAYYSSPAWHGPCGAHYRRPRVRPCAAPRPYRGYLYGPIIRASRHW